MVKLLIGHKGSGKTGQMIQLANDLIETCNGSLVFINKDSRLNMQINRNIRVVCMDDFEDLTNTDEYIGFLYGIISSDHDIEAIFLDSILKHADVSLGDLPEFINRLKGISDKYELDFIVSLSAEKEEMIGVNFVGCEIINQ